MSLLARRLIFYLLLAFFVISTPLIIGYTAGYRYHFKQRRLVKTGALSITSAPDNAFIKLNNKLLDSQTPALIVDIMPGNYEIILEREGYHSWQKTLPIEKEKTTFARNVPLFKKTAPVFQGLSFQEGQSLKQRPETVQNYENYKVFYDGKRGVIAVVDNKKQRRLAELPGDRAVWREKPTPLLFVYSAHEVWQFDPQNSQQILITRLIQDIEDLIILPKTEAILLIVGNRAQAVELDSRDKQNTWTLAEFDSIKNAALADDGKILEILGTYQGKEGAWNLLLQ